MSPALLVGMEPRLRLLLFSLAASAGAIWLGVALANEEYLMATLTAGSALWIIFAWSRGPLAETWLLSLVFFGYIIGNRGFAQITPLASLPLFFSELSLACLLVMAALRGALSDRARNGRVHVISAVVEGDAPSAKAAVATVASITDRRNVLVVVERDDTLGWKSLRNVDGVHLLVSDQLNTYDVLVNDHVLFTEDALEAFVAGSPAGKSAKAVATEGEVSA